MDHADKYIMQAGIASMLDHPSVYMGGPSKQSMKNADRVVRMILDEYDVQPKEKATKAAEIARTWLQPSEA